MGLFWKRDQGDDRSTLEVVEAVGSELFHRCTGGCSAFCSSDNCGQRREDEVDDEGWW